MIISLYIPHTNLPSNIPFIKIKDLKTFCHIYDSYGVFKHNQYIFNINKSNKSNKSNIFFLIINNDNNILSIPISKNNIDIFKLQTNEFNIIIYFKHKEIINTKKFNLFQHLGYQEFCYETKEITPKIDKIIINTLPKLY